MKRIHYYTDPQGNTENGLTLTEVKRRIKRFGGSGHTQHFDRDGSFQESTPIVLDNNACTTYRAEYNTSRKYSRPQQPASDGGQVNTEDIIARTLDKAKASSVGEDDNDILMQMLGEELTAAVGDRAGLIADWSIERLLSHIHALLGHEYRGFHRSGRMSDSVRKWKQQFNSQNHE